MFRTCPQNRSHFLLAALAFFSLVAFAPGAEAGRAANKPPVISGTPARAAVVGAAYAFQPSAYDPEGRVVIFKIKGKPTWATFSSATGRLSGTPSTAGTTPLITITASDGKKAASLPAFNISVSAAVVNSAPSITGSPVTSSLAGSNYSFRPTASDANGDPLTFSIVGKPSWASFEAATGTLYGTPLAIDAGTYSGITISVSDGKASTSLAAFTITVTTPPVTNRAPTISGAAVTTAQVDRPYAFQPTANDADNDALTFSITNKPVWATFDAANGTLYGTPTASHVGSTTGIVISVSDGKDKVSLAPFSITIAPAPTRTVTLNWTAPTINTDGSALTDLAGYTVFYGNASRQYSTSMRLTGAGTNSVVVEGLAPGSYYFSIKSINNAGVESDYAGEVVAQL
jgi:Putative Ig domain